MKIAALLFLLFITNPETEVADTESVTFSGLVVEASTGEPLPGATVLIKELDEKIYTDFDGKFYIESLKPGIYDIEISFISFEEEKLSGVTINQTNNSLLVSLE